MLISSQTKKTPSFEKKEVWKSGKKQQQKTTRALASSKIIKKQSNQKEVITDSLSDFKKYTNASKEVVKKINLTWRCEFK